MNRERLTITLRQDLLKALDGEIDGDRLRNRSHAIEYFLSRSLGLKAVKVLILAGGKPVFFESENKTLPKAMVKIAGKPLIEQTLKRLKAAKFTQIFISIGEGGEIIEKYFGDGSQMGINITYIHQPAGNGGNAKPLLQAKQFFDSSFLVLYGDVLSEIDFADFVEFHRNNQKQSLCTMALAGTDTVEQWGLAKLQGNKIVAFEEKPKNPKTFSRLVNAGVYMMEPGIFKLVETSPPSPLPSPARGEGVKSIQKLESDIFPHLAEEGKLYGYPYEGLWLDISNSAAYKEAMKQINHNNHN